MTTKPKHTPARAEQWTPEPWAVTREAPGAIAITMPDGLLIAVVRYSDNPRITQEQARANASRIVACVNALEGVEDPSSISAIVHEDSPGHVVMTTRGPQETTLARQAVEATRLLTGPYTPERALACARACEGLSDPSVIPELVGLLHTLIASNDNGSIQWVEAISFLARAEGHSK